MCGLLWYHPFADFIVQIKINIITFGEKFECACSYDIGGHKTGEYEYKESRGNYNNPPIDVSGDEVMINYKIYENGQYKSGKENLNSLEGKR